MQIWLWLRVFPVQNTRFKKINVCVFSSRSGLFPCQWCWQAKIARQSANLVVDENKITVMSLEIQLCSREKSILIFYGNHVIDFPIWYDWVWLRLLSLIQMHFSKISFQVKTWLSLNRAKFSDKMRKITSILNLSNNNYVSMLDASRNSSIVSQSRQLFYGFLTQYREFAGPPAEIPAIYRFWKNRPRKRPRNRGFKIPPTTPAGGPAARENARDIRVLKK